MGGDKISSSIEIPNFDLDYTKVDGKVYLEFKADFGEFNLPNGNIIKIKNPVIHINDEILITGTAIEKITTGMNHLNFKLSTDKWEIQISKCMIFNTEWPSNKFKAHGLKIKAQSGEIHENELIKHYALVEKVKFNNGSSDPISFTPHSLEKLKLIQKEVLGFPNSTGFFYFKDTYELIETKWENVFKNLYFLLSFFSSNFIGLRVSFIEGNNYKELKATTLNKTSGNGNSIFYEEYPFELSKFLNSTYDNYVAQKEKLNLIYVIDYYIWMKNQSYAEPKYALGCILLETLKYAYAKYCKRYTEKGNSFYKHGTNYRYTFKELIYEIFSYFNIDINKLQSWIDNVENGFYYIRSDLNNYCSHELEIKNYKQLLNEISCVHNISLKRSFIEYVGKYRNEVIHTGKLETPYHNLSKNLNYLERSIEVLLLKILGAKCEYWDQPNEKWVRSDVLLDSID